MNDELVSKSNKITVVIVFTIIIIGAIAMYFMVGGNEFINFSFSEADTVKYEITSEQLRSKNLETDLFYNDVFTSMKDYSIDKEDIQEIKKGRNNPFLPIE